MPAESLSARERNNPPPRQKACAACIKAKRRCSLGQPSCLRCSQRMLKCVYPSRPEGPRRDAASHETHPGVMRPLEESPGMPASDPLADLSSWEPTIDFNSLNMMSPSQIIQPTPCSSFPSLSFEDTPLQAMSNFMTVAEEPLIPANSVSPLLAADDPTELIVRETRNVRERATQVTKLRLLHAASELVEKRLSYALDAFQRVPENMVSDGGTMWMHPRVFANSMPDFLEDAYTACALHGALTSTNSAVVQRTILQRYHKLLFAPAPTTCGRSMLARTHALLLYQTMLYWSPSHLARALAQETESLLEESAVQLIAHFGYNDDLESSRTVKIPLYPAARAKAFFDDWVYQESMRRTMLAALFFVSMIRTGRGQVTPAGPLPPSSMSASTSAQAPADDGANLAAITQALENAGPAVSPELGPCDWRLALCRSVTLSAHLWHARDAVDFAVAWRDRDHLVVRPWNVLDKMQNAEPDDLDEFGRVLMTAGLSVEEVKAWFAAKGGML